MGYQSSLLPIRVALLKNFSVEMVQDKCGNWFIFPENQFGNVYQNSAFGVTHFGVTRMDKGIVLHAIQLINKILEAISVTTGI